MHKQNLIKKRIMLFLINVIVCCAFLIQYLNKGLMPIFLEYGEYQCMNVLTRIVNLSIEETVTDQLKTKTVVQKEDDGVDFNMEILNSIRCNVLNRIYQLLYFLDKGILDKEIIKKINPNVNKEQIKRGVIYEIPMARAFDNALIGNLGINIPVKYRLVGEIQGEFVSSVKEYGINNALLEISLKITAQTKVLVPMISKDKKIEVSVPMVVKMLQGDIPDYYLGSHIVGGAK